MSSSTSRIRVIARTRPTANFAKDVLKLEEDGKTISVHLPKNDDQLKGFINNQQQDWSFPLDKYLHNASQEVVYSECAGEIATKVLDGYNGTIMAYGQTGAGKTYTMTGGHSQSYRQRGVVPRAISHIFAEIKARIESSINLHVSYLEIYNEVVHDLLSTLPDAKPGRPSTGLQVTEDDSGCVSVKGLTLRPVASEEEALNYLFEGETNRSISEHALNKHSSRSHCIFTIYVENRSKTQSSSTFTVSKLNLVDLAGSERLNKTQPTGSTEKEAMYINKSLSFLEQVIVALADRRREHIPYRQSKLTHVLRDSLGGNCNTLMIANVWAEPEQIEETIATLKFSARMMCVSNDPVHSIQHDPFLLIRDYEQEIKALKLELAMHDTLFNRGSVNYEPLGEAQLEEIASQVKNYVDGSANSIEIVSVRQVKEAFAQFKALVKCSEDSGYKTTEPTPAVEPDKPSGKGKIASPKSKPLKQQTIKNLPPVEAEDNLVGDSDGTGFALGVAPASVKNSTSPMAAGRKAKAGDKKEPKLSVPKSEGTDEEPAESSPSEVEEPRPSTPPPKEEAFEQFKQERGREINQILLQNKETYQKKKKEAKELSESINALKKDIDKVCEYLDSCANERKIHGEVRTDSGGLVIEEQEFQAISQLKQLKSDYRERHDALQAVNAECRYCQQYVDKSRERLLSEFESWYRLAFGEEPVEESPVEFPNERFDRLQVALLRDDPATTAFYNAKLRTNRRLLESSPKKPGHVTSSVRNRPPGIMSFS